MNVNSLSSILYIVALLCSGPAHSAEPVDADVLLTGATIYDGTGAAAIQGDVALKGERIVGVGRFPVASAALEIDCSGLVLAPGFIDLHNHSDRQIVDRRTRGNVNYLLQGCTTIVTGNCGSGPVDVREYYEKIDSAGAGTNVVHFLPQGSLRSQAIGAVQRSAKPDELSEMKKLAAKAMQDGAWGMSTGLIYVPSSYADTGELIAVAKVVSAFGGIYASHIRNENVELLAAVAEALKIGREASLPVHISHFKSSGRESWGLVRRAAQMIEEARQGGQIATADQYPYIASSTSLDATLIPTWARAGGRRDLISRLDDSTTAARIREAMVDNLKRRNGGESLIIARYAPRQEWVGKSLAEISKSENKGPLDVALQIARSGGASVVNFSMSEDDVRHIMQVPWVATASDGRAYLPSADRPHPRSYGTFARKIGHYSIRQNVLTLAQAIRSASGLPADILGMSDRGYLKTGAYADVTAFDPKQLIDVATFKSPHQYSKGIRFVFVNGHISVYEGSPTGALAGRALKHQPTTETSDSP